MDRKQIILQRQIGDIRTVANIIGESYQNTDKILRRTNSKKHDRAVEILVKIIEHRNAIKAMETINTPQNENV